MDRFRVLLSKHAVIALETFDLIIECTVKALQQGDFDISHFSSNSFCYWRQPKVWLDLEKQKFPLYITNYCNGF